MEFTKKVELSNTSIFSLVENHDDYKIAKRIYEKNKDMIISSFNIFKELKYNNQIYSPSILCYLHGASPNVYDMLSVIILKELNSRGYKFSEFVIEYSYKIKEHHGLDCLTIRMK